MNFAKKRDDGRRTFLHGVEDLSAPDAAVKDVDEATQAVKEKFEATLSELSKLIPKQKDRVN
ncbi:hypothetical protein [Ruegeria atlantica]|uniref:hypothetical protein n=1 Tax=Ruegeria atlantica TaxID=81569 RepID=UPI00147FBA31|nr:hypothetical protein [Ruegeria atlantica]